MKIYRLKESKTTQLKKLLKNGNITEEQFQIADEFFKKYSAFENEIDWNRGLKITWDDLKAVIYKERNSESQTKKKIRKGLEGFTEGKDYLVLEETGSYTAYQPFTWEASRMIASHYVEPSRNEDGKIEDANWCTAYQKDRTYWDGHNKIEAFIYICGESIPTKKVAVSISEEDYDASGSEFLYYTGSLNYNIWDFDDYNYLIEKKELLKVVPNLYALIKKAYKNWENKNEESISSKLKLNPQTNRYACDGDLDSSDLKLFVSENKDGFTINFGKVTGHFDCSELALVSLKGAPTEVGGYFDCHNNRLTSLKGAPQKVGGGFFCYGNNLTSLKGAPTEVGRDFICSDNLLTSLEGAPQEVGGRFDCSRNQLTSLEGAPKEIGGWFDCSDNRLTSLEGAPQKIGGDFSCFGNQLTSLVGAPREVDWSFDCSKNKLTSLEGAPQTVGGWFGCANNQLISLERAPKTVGSDFYCYGNKLTSLKGAPQEVGGGFYCDRNQLTSLEGAPQKVRGSFICPNNKLTSLKGAPQKVGGIFSCHSNPNLHSLEGIGEVKGRIVKDF